MATAPSSTQTSSATATSLIAYGSPFLPFPTFSILELQQPKTPGGSLPFSEWLTKRLQLGQPVVIRDFDKLPEWDREEFGLKKLIELSTKKSIPIRNCSTGRDLSFTLRKFADAARQSHSEFQNLYARDLQCPRPWLEKCREILPAEVQWGGRLDLFQWLPACARSEVMMAYVGSEGSTSGFHRCFSSTVALNLLLEAHDGPVTCFGTDFESQAKYDTFMSSHGVSPHLDWLNLGPEQLKKADFPLYAHEQQVGELVVFPPATAHQVWNTGTICTKLVWNILHPLSLEVGFNYVQPPFNRLCSPDVARTSLSLACAMLSLNGGDPHIPGVLPPDLPLLSRLFRQVVDDESIRGPPATPIALVKLSETVIATCDFCSTAIWNRHMRCTECNDFDLCLSCYLAGRSCEHASSYSWAEIVTEQTCSQALSRAREILGFQPEERKHSPDQPKPLGTAVNELMQLKQSSTTRLCHLCRIDHPEWKGRRCDKCSAFFCFRGLYRHFDVNSADVIRHGGLWTCPKCVETCNCRCCHFSSAYIKAEKPASKRRVKPADARGKVMGFTDNVFDQKRGQKSSTLSSSQSISTKGQKRPLPADVSEIFQRPPPRHIELPTSEPDLASAEAAPLLQGYYDGDYSHASPQVREPITGLSLFMPNLRNTNNPYIPAVASTEGTSTNTIPLTRDDKGRSGRVPADGMRTLAAAAASRDRMQVSLSPLVPDMDDTTFQPPLPPLVPKEPRSLQMSDSPALPSLDPNLTSSSSPSTTPRPTQPSHNANTDDPIVLLETQISQLKKYGEELLELSLTDSYKLLAQKVEEMERETREMRKERARMLIGKLEGEGGWLGESLREVVGEEVRRLGYV